jgi:hypothetical protein
MDPGSQVGFQISTKNKNLLENHPTRLSLTLNPMEISHFPLFFLKPQNRFEPNLAEMFFGWSYTRFLFLALIENPTWLPGYWFQRILFCIFPIGSYVKTMSAGGGHLGWNLEFPISKRFTSLVQDHPLIIPAKSQFNWLSGLWPP